jgi:hypothetical protein|tara:strand:+ start:331 stop:453 length:123 start_codon:yes stop_codon:yes gene_type:complete
MERIIECVKRYIMAKFSGRIVLHFHEGVIKKIHKEQSIEF